jgi:hypothetical protein
VTAAILSGSEMTNRGQQLSDEERAFLSELVQQGWELPPALRNRRRRPAEVVPALYPLAVAVHRLRRHFTWARMRMPWATVIDRRTGTRERDELIKRNFALATYTPEQANDRRPPATTLVHAEEDR